MPTQTDKGEDMHACILLASLCTHEQIPYIPLRLFQRGIFPLSLPLSLSIYMGKPPFLSSAPTNAHGAKYAIPSAYTASSAPQSPAETCPYHPGYYSSRFSTLQQHQQQHLQQQ